MDEDTLIVERAEGTDLIDVHGNRYIDGVSSLWCNVHGHGHPRIDAAVRDQLDRVAHSTMLGLSHRPGIELAQRLAELAPTDLTRVFYSDSGSTATEIALKMAFQFWRQRGEQRRTRFVSLRMAYHGDTIGSVSVGGIDLFHSMYRPLLFDALQVEPGHLHDDHRAGAEAVGAVHVRRVDRHAVLVARHRGHGQVEAETGVGAPIPLRERVVRPRQQARLRLRGGRDHHQCSDKRDRRESSPHDGDPTSGRRATVAAWISPPPIAHISGIRSRSSRAGWTRTC